MSLTGQVTGRWKNSKPSTNGIEQFTLTDDGTNLSLSIRGAEHGFMPDDMGPLKTTAYSADGSSTDCIAFHAKGMADGKTYSFAGNVNKGLIIIAIYIEVSNNEADNFFVREFFYKLK